jgi:hypothetical protein
MEKKIIPFEGDVKITPEDLEGWTDEMNEIPCEICERNLQCDKSRCHSESD